MYDFSVALQLYSVRDDMETDFEGTLKRIKDLGYDGVEFAGLYDHSAAEVKNMCAKAGLKPVSAHVPYPELLIGEEAFKTYAEIGCKYIVIPGMSKYLTDDQSSAEAYENIKILGKLAIKYGMKLCYHNHDFEFEKVDGEYKLDNLYANISPELLSTQLDTCWVNVGGENPADYIRKYAGRVEIVHLKDFAGQKSENMYGLIGTDTESAEKAKGKFEFRPVGSGLQDFPSILAASNEVGASWLVVEQDQPSMGKTPLECAEASINYLKSLF